MRRHDGLEARAYTMRMGRKGAILMLVVAALWAVLPALVCFAAAPCHDCCRAMGMDGNMAMLGMANSCCQMQSSSATVPPANAVAPKMQMGSVQTLPSALLPGFITLAGEKPSPTKAPPPRSLLGASTILRI